MPLAFTQTTDPDLKILRRAIKRFEDSLEPDSTVMIQGAKKMAEPARDYASSITHQDTATLWRSYDVAQGSGSSGAFATVFVDPSIVNPRGQRPVDYAFYEFARGGSHDAFGRTIARSGAFVDSGVDYILKEAAKAAKI